MVPDSCQAPVDGVSQVLNGFYMAAVQAGLCAGLGPSKGHTNYPMTGLTKVYGSHDTFSESDLNTIAGGGGFIVIQDTDTSPLFCRHQLSTDVSSVQTRELNITKALDYTSKIVRGSVTKIVGRNNITSELLSDIGTKVQGVLDLLVMNKVIKSGQVVSVSQSEVELTTVLVQVAVAVLYPGNYFVITISAS